MTAHRHHRTLLLVCLAVVVMALVSVAISFVRGPFMGESRAYRQAEAERYDDRCNTERSGGSVPVDVDRAFRDVGRLESHRLRGPVTAGRHACTMVVVGEGDPAYAAWRSHLLDSGWRVVRDDDEVVVARDGVELRLYLADEVAYVEAAEAGRHRCPLQVSREVTSGAVEMWLVSPTCS